VATHDRENVEGEETAREAAVERPSLGESSHWKIFKEEEPKTAAPEA
jgi:hypothetical protein